MALAGSAGIIALVAVLAKAVYEISKAFNGIGKAILSVNDVIHAFAGAINRVGKAVSNSLNAMAIKNIAIAIAILAGSIIALTYVGKNNMAEMWVAVGVIGALATILGGLFAVITLLSESKTTVIDIGKISAAIFSIAAAMIVLTIAAKIIGGMDEGEFKQAAIGIGSLAVVMVVLMGATKLLAKTPSGTVASSAYKSGEMLMSIAKAMIIMAIAAKILGTMDTEGELERGLGALSGLAVMMVALMAATRAIAKTANGNISTGIEHAGNMLFKIAAAMFVSENTVEAHRKSLFAKLGAINGVHLIVKAIGRGYLKKSGVKR